MSMMNQGGTGDAGGQGGNGGAADDANKNGGGVSGDANNGANGGEGAGKEAVHDGEFDVNAIGEDMKNPEVYKNGLFAGKYKTLAEWAKGTKEITSKVREPAKAPDEYDFSKLKIEGHDGVTVDKDDPIAKALLPVMKELGLSQEQADKLAAAYLPAFMAGQPDPAKERAALGDKGDAMIKNFNDTVADAPKEIKEALDRLPFSADLTRVLDWAFAGKVEAAIPARLNGAEGKNAAQLKQEAFDYKAKHSKTIESNPEQQQEYQRLMDAWGKADEAEAKAKK